MIERFKPFKSFNRYARFNPFFHPPHVVERKDMGKRFIPYFFFALGPNGSG